jgi:hypothetical protein
MLTGVDAATALVVTVKTTLVPPDATVTDAGTVAAAVLPLVSATAIPSAGAAPLRVTVPLEFEVPITVAGFRVNPLRAGGFTVRAAVWLAPP